MFKYIKQAAFAVVAIGVLAVAPLAAEAHERDRSNVDAFIRVVLPDNKVISYRSGDSAGLGRVLSRYEHHYYNPHERVFVVYNGYRDVPYWAKKRAHKHARRYGHRHNHKEVVVVKPTRYYEVADNNHRDRRGGHRH